MTPHPTGLRPATFSRKGRRTFSCPTPAPAPPSRLRFPGSPPHRLIPLAAALVLAAAPAAAQPVSTKLPPAVTVEPAPDAKAKGW